KRVCEVPLPPSGLLSLTSPATDGDTATCDTLRPTSGLAPFPTRRAVIGRISTASQGLLCPSWCRFWCRLSVDLRRSRSISSDRADVRNPDRSLRVLTGRHRSPWGVSRARQVLELALKAA